MEGLLNYVYYQTEAINQYDEIGHLLHFSIFDVATGPCANYNGGEFNGQPGVPNTDGSAATTNIRDAHRCVAWLGRNQPGINQDLGIPPYDSSVCPQGSTDTSICDPSSSLAATAAAKASGKRARSGETAGGNAPGGGNPADGGGAPAGPGTPVVPGVPTTPAPGADPTPPAAPGAPSSPPGNDDLLGFLFGN